MKVQSLKPNAEDDRGIIQDILAGQPMDAATVITQKKGAVRGNHFHKDTIQWAFLWTGKLEYVTQTGDAEIEKHVMNPGDLVRTDPLEKHAIRALEDSMFIVLTRGPRGGENYEDDTYRLETPIAVPG